MSARSCKYQSFLASQKSESPRSRPKGLAKTRAARRLSWGVSFVFLADPLRSWVVNFFSHSGSCSTVKLSEANFLFARFELEGF